MSGHEALALPTLDINFKICSSCGKSKPWSAYSSQSAKEFRPCSYCRRCQRAYCKEHYRRNRDAHNRGRYMRARGERKAIREFLWRYLEMHGCMDCGERDIVVLEFDHVSGKKEAEVSVMAARGATRERLEKEI